MNEDEVTFRDSRQGGQTNLEYVSLTHSQTFHKTKFYLYVFFGEPSNVNFWCRLWYNLKKNAQIITRFNIGMK